MKIRHIYLLIAIPGTAIPLWFFFQFLLANGMNLPLFLDQMTANPIASFFTWDVIISSLALIVLVLTEGRRLKMKRIWVFIVFNLLVGVSLALPAFLYARKLKIHSGN